MKTSRHAGLQAMAHVAAGHHGDAPARATRRGGDGPAQFRQARFAREVEADHNRRPAPAGIGQMPQGHDRAMIQLRVAQPPNFLTARPGLFGNHPGKRFVRGKIHSRRRRAELRQRTADPVARPNRKRLLATRCVWRDENNRLRSGPDDPPGCFGHRANGCGGLIAALPANRRHQHRRVRHQRRDDDLSIFHPHTPAIFVPQKRHLPSVMSMRVTAKMSRSTMAFLQLGHQVVPAPSRPGTLPI